jgi:hypothetical protein
VTQHRLIPTLERLGFAAGKPAGLQLVKKKEAAQTQTIRASQR